ncbi:MAG TPA: hypothetical protein VFT75_14485 [Nocardioidaceae bacterium]|nr:hypothetical protein [Nocardioidaceae bacterium]
MTDASPSRPAPVPLRIAALLAALEGALVVGYAAAELFSISGSRAVMGLTTTVFFCVYGVALIYFAWELTRLKSWARSPIVLAQLIQVLVGWGFRGGPTIALTVGLTVSGVVVLVCLFHPASLRALSHDPGREQG